MRIQRLIICTSLFLSTWLTASFLYATPREFVNALEGQKSAQQQSSSAPDMVKSEGL